MSPKGGIRPHRRFATGSKRSEVLFVDYIISHLNDDGRAGVIVLEGVIFQSGNAYKQLRRRLVQNCLVAVVSLPGGVFQPYSGVKTTILIMDKSLAQKADGIAFFKVQHDGYNLGAQRRPITTNDLPTAQAEIAEYLRRLQTGATLDDFTPTLGQVVSKNRLADGGEYNLSGERYRENGRRDSEFPYVRLDAVAKIAAGNPAPQGVEYFQDGEFPFIRTSDVGAVHRSDNFAATADKVNRKAVDELRLRLSPPGTILFPKSGASTFLNHRALTSTAAYVSSHLACIICDEAQILPKYAYNLLCRVDARDITPEQAYPSLRLKEIGNIEIPLPPLEVQREIVAEIEAYQRVIDGARAVVDNWRPSIDFDPDWSTETFSEIASEKPKYGSTASKADFDGKIRYVRITDITETGELKEIDPVSPSEIDEQYFLEADDLLIARSGSVGRTYLHQDRPIPHQYAGYLIRFRIDRAKALPKYVFYVTKSDVWTSWIARNSKVGTINNINAKQYSTFALPLPPLATQQAIVADLEAEQTAVNHAQRLAARMQARIDAAIGRVWAAG